MTLTRDFVLAYLAEAMQDSPILRGYTWLPGKRQFRCTTAAGFQDLIFSISAYEDAVWAELHLGLRLSAVEDVVLHFTRTLPGFHPDAHTVILSEGKLIGQPYLRHEVRHTTDLDALAAQWLDFWQAQAQPFLDAHFHLTGVDRLLNQNLAGKSPYLPNPAHRYLKGLVVAKLLQRPRFEQLVPQYRAYLAQTPTGSLLLTDFDRLAGYLLKMSLN